MHKKWWFWVIVVGYVEFVALIFIAVVVGMTGGFSSDTSTTKAADTEVTTDSLSDADELKEQYNQLNVDGKSYAQVKKMIFKIDKGATIKEKNIDGDTIHDPKAKVTEIEYHTILDYVEVFTNAAPERVEKTSSSVSSSVAASSVANETENLDPKQKKLNEELKTIGIGYELAKGDDLTRYEEQPIEQTENYITVLLASNSLPTQKEFYKNPQYWKDILNEAANDTNAIYGTDHVTLKSYSIWTGTNLLYKQGEDF